MAMSDSNKNESPCKSTPMMLTPLTNELNAPIIYSFLFIKSEGSRGGASFYLLRVKGVEGAHLFIY